MKQGLCIFVGYLFGCLLTAELASRLASGKGASQDGFGNPGMANVAAKFGIKMGILVLAGDVLKTVAAIGICRTLFPDLGQAAAAYAGLGAALGHDFPFWKKFCGGKGVAVTCTASVFFSPAVGIPACLLGLLALPLSGYLAIGSAVIGIAYPVLTAVFRYSAECILLNAVSGLLMIFRHLPNYRKIAVNQEKRVFRRAKKD